MKRVFWKQQGLTGTGFNDASTTCFERLDLDALVSRIYFLMRPFQRVITINQGYLSS